jgi:hypothetical protein
MGIANATALKKFIVHHEAASFEVANAINITLRLADQMERGAINRRLEAGRMLVSLRKRVEADGVDWWKWAKGRMDRSRKDIEKLIQIANADEPEVAAEDAAQKNRIHQATHRTKTRAAAYVSGSPTAIFGGMPMAPAKAAAMAKQAALADNQPLIDRVNKFTRELDRFINDDYCPRIRDFLQTHPELADEAKVSLIENLELCAGILQQLGQTIDGR